MNFKCHGEFILVNDYFTNTYNTLLFYGMKIGNIWTSCMMDLDNALMGILARMCKQNLVCPFLWISFFPTYKKKSELRKLLDN